MISDYNKVLLFCILFNCLKILLMIPEILRIQIVKLLYLSNSFYLKRLINLFLL